MLGVSLLSFEEFKKNLKILLVEDDILALSILEKLISKEKYRVFTAKNGVEGVEVFKKEGVDIIVSDINMPEMNGLDMVRELKRIDKNIKVLFLSAYSDVNHIIDALELKAESYILKPFDASTLISNIQKVAYINYSIYISSKEDERRAREETLKNKIAFIEEIAHHWRQPLNAVSLNLELISAMLDDIEMDKDSRKLIDEAIETSMCSMQKLSEVITNFSQVMNSNSKKSEYLYKIFQRYKNIYTKSIENIKLKIELDINQDLIFEGHVESLQTIANEMIKNSIEAMERRGIENGTITISAKKSNGYLVINIKDNALGIDEVIGDRLFEPYVSTKIKSHGEGMGLYLVYKALKQHLGGSISYKNLKNGCKFIIKIPQEHSTKE